VLAENFLKYEGAAIRHPRILTGPSSDGLAWHRENVFKG
jgi:hypothetical protein